MACGVAHLGSVAAAPSGPTAKAANCFAACAAISLAEQQRKPARETPDWRGDDPLAGT
jgi:hypothetical protein